jgi:hypothetical protein
MIGTSLNQYRITGTVGVGGMGEVFRARDTRLNRDVAIKVLPKDFVSDADRLRRFEQEAKTLAALNHPNVLTVFDAGVHDGAPYLVGELLEGKTLREEMNGGALPVRKATDYALQVAHGLAAAHGKGIIHRDLKPENIFVAKDGRVKILDFGLAKLKQVGRGVPTAPLECGNAPGGSLGTASPTIRIDADAIINTTEPGAVLGTPAYMSPEQVRGEPADHRADIFAFGTVLYEMLSGTRAFRRNTPVESMNAVLNDVPPELTTTHPNIPLPVSRLVERCLEKQSDNRFQSAKDLAFALTEIASARPAVPPGRGSRARRWRMAAAWVAAVALVGAAYWAGHRGRPPVESPASNWRGDRLGGPSIALQPRISPDGNELAFAVMDHGITQVGVMMVESGDWRILTTNRTGGFVADVGWSRKGTEIYYDRGGAVYRVSKYGGEERLVLESAGKPEVLPDDSVLVMGDRTNRVRRLLRHWLGRRTNPLNAIFAPAPEGYGHGYRVLPGGGEVVFLGWPADAKVQEEGLWLLDLQTDHAELLDPQPPPRMLGLAYAPLAGNPRDHSVSMVTMADNLYRVISGPPADFARRRTEVSLTLALFGLDFSPDGSLYLDQVERPSEVMCFAGSNVVQRVPLSASYERREVLPLPGGRLLLPSRLAGQNRLVVMANGRDPVPFLQSREEGREPLAMLGRDQVLCRVGSGTNLAVAVVSAADGKVVKRMEAIPADDSLVALAGSPDGRTVYFVAKGAVWSVPVEGGSLVKIRVGDGVAPDPNGKFLIVQILKPDTNQLVRVPLDGGPEVVLPVPARLTHYPITPNAVHSDGRIVVPVAPPDLWYWPAAILDPATGKLELVPETHADMLAPGWDEEGRVVAVGQLLRSSLWRFRPEK